MCLADKLTVYDVLPEYFPDKCLKLKLALSC